MQEVTGSSPVPRTKSLWHLRCHRLFFVVSPRTGKADVESGHGRIWNPPLRFLWRAERTRVFPCCVCRGDHWSPANLPPQRIFRDSCLVRQAGTGEQCSPLQEFSPVWARNIPARRTVLSPTACGRSPRAEGAKRGRVFACCACKRIYFRLRLVKNHLMWYTISLQVHRQTRCKPATQSYRGPSGQPVANKKLLFYCRR